MAPISTTPAPVSFGSHAILAQNVFLCGATQDYDQPEFPLIAFCHARRRIRMECTRDSMAPGVKWES